MKKPIATILTCWLALLCPLSAQQENWNVVRKKTESRLKEIASGTRGAVGLVAVDLTSGERFSMNENFVFPQASAIKIPILMEVYKQAAEGKFKLTDLHGVGKRHQVAGSGVLQHFGDGTSRLSIRDLAVLMILVSDNTATNMLIDLVGKENINATMAGLGFGQTRLQRRMIDPAASGRGEENISTPAEAALIMERLYRGEFLGREACDDMLAILRMSKSGGISSGLPSGVPVAFKPGGLAGVATEWAIVYLQERPYIVIFMENYGMQGEAAAAMKAISGVLYDHFWRLGRSTRHGTYVDPQWIR